MIAAEVRAKWDERDARYAHYHNHVLTDGEIEAVRIWRLQEAHAVDDARLEHEARTWMPPVLLRR